MEMIDVETGLVNALKKLNEKERKLILAIYREKISYEDLAVEFEKDKKTIKRWEESTLNKMRLIEV